MPRSIWNGTVGFGLIAVPVKVTSATEDQGVHFHQVHLADGARIKQRRVCSKEDKEVPYSEVAKGYETSKGEYVLLSGDEIAAAGGERSRQIDLEAFVSADEIDPVFYERSYYLGPGKDGEAAYRLLHDALARTGRSGIGRWVFHNREYLVAVGASNGVLALHTMRFADELVSADDLDVPEPSRAPSTREIEMAGALVDSLLGNFEPGRYQDSHRKALLALIERKAKGEEIELPPRAEPEETPDLLAALEASLGKKRPKPRASGARSRSRSSGSRSGGSRTRSRR
ncbi:MAG TPA: Ku protein [Solirubrobacteraceae bacterium]|nr:Ku protein [Solirubrobacteraceae bacterium]